MQKYLKNNKGFTLVEVIVVAVIVLVLAAVAIPLYNGYINDSRQAAVENAAGAIASALGAAVQQGITKIAPANKAGPDAYIVIGDADKKEPVVEILVPKGMEAEYDGSNVTVTHEKKKGNDDIKAVVPYSIP